MTARFGNLYRHHDELWYTCTHNKNHAEKAIRMIVSTNTNLHMNRMKSPVTTIDRPFAPSLHSHNVLNGAGNGLPNSSAHNFVNISGHSCNTRTHYARDVSLSNIFADDEETIGIFGENSLVGFTTTQATDTTERKPRPQPKDLLISIGSSSNWQGSCNSFLGSSSELLDLSFIINDFEKCNDQLSLHKKIAASPKPNSVQKQLSFKDKMLMRFHANANQNTAIPAAVSPGKKRTIRPKVSYDTLTGKPCGGGMHCLVEDLECASPDAAPRIPIRRPEHQSPVMAEEAKLVHDDMVNTIADLINSPIVKLDDESCDGEVIKFNLTPSRKRYEALSRSDSCPIFSGHDAALQQVRPKSTTPLQQLRVEKKEDAAPKCPRRETSPERSNIQVEKRTVSRDENRERQRVSLISANQTSKLASDTLQVQEMGMEGNNTTRPKKKVAKIAIKDLASFVADTSGKRGMSHGAAISPQRYRKIMEAAKSKNFNSNNIKHEPPRKDMDDIDDTESSSLSMKSPVPHSIALDYSERSMSSMDDSSRRCSRTRRTVSALSMDSRSYSPMRDEIRKVQGDVRLNPTSSRKMSPQKLTSSTSCRALVSPSGNNRVVNRSNVTSSRKMSPQKLTSSTSCRALVSSADTNCIVKHDDGQETPRKSRPDFNSSFPSITKPPPPRKRVDEITVCMPEWGSKSLNVLRPKLQNYQSKSFTTSRASSCDNMRNQKNEMAELPPSPRKRPTYFMEAVPEDTGSVRATANVPVYDSNLITSNNNYEKQHYFSPVRNKRTVATVVDHNVRDIALNRDRPPTTPTRHRTPTKARC
jgi:hypothetical protein